MDIKLSYSYSGKICEMPSRHPSPAPSREAPAYTPRTLSSVKLPYCIFTPGGNLSAAPYRNRRNSRGGVCQIDLLIQTARTAYVVETKRQFEIGRNVEDQVAREMKRLHIRADMSVRPVLVYLGQLDASVEGDGFFDAIIPAQKLLK